MTLLGNFSWYSLLLLSDHHPANPRSRSSPDGRQPVARTLPRIAYTNHGICSGRVGFGEIDWPPEGDAGEGDHGGPGGALRLGRDCVVQQGADGQALIQTVWRPSFVHKQFQWQICQSSPIPAVCVVTSPPAPPETRARRRSLCDLGQPARSDSGLSLNNSVFRLNICGNLLNIGGCIVEQRGRFHD